MSQSSAITPGQFTTFGDLLKFLRHRAGLTQQELANAVGYSVSHISRLEKNHRAPDNTSVAARFVPELNLQQDREWVARLLELAASSHAEKATQAQADQVQTPRHNLPARLDSFVGRETELAAIAARLKNPDCRLLTLLGAGGIGKTRLALEAAAMQLNGFPDGVFFVPLAPLQAGQAALIVPTIANAVGFTLIGARPHQLQLVDWLRPKQLLLLLDNFEHVLEGRELVLEIIRNAPQVSVIVTSRASLHVKPEWLLHIRGLSYPQTIAPGRDEVLASGAAQFFLARASQLNKHFILNAETTAAISRICQTVEGMPLALELAAARTRIFPIDEIANQVSASLDTLQSKMHDTLARHRTLRAVLDWSYELLSGPERALFCSLSVFAGGWTLDAAEAVGVGANVAVADVATLLKDLVDQSLVEIEPEHAMAPYRMLEPVRQYAFKRLKLGGAAETVQHRHAEYYLNSARFDAEHFDYKFDLTETELDNLRAAMAWSQSNEIYVDLKLQLADAVGWLCIIRGYLGEGRSWLEKALVGTRGAKDLRTLVEARLAEALGRLGMYATAEAQFLVAKKHFQELGSEFGQAWMLQRLGWLAREQGESSNARTYLEQSLSLYERLGDHLNLAWSSVNLGDVFVMQEETDKASVLLEQSLLLFRSLGASHTDGVAWALNHLGHVAQLQGDYPRARQYHEESLSLFRQDVSAAWAYHSLGETALAQGDAILATMHFKHALSLFHDMGSQADISWCLAGLAGVAVLEEDPKRAAFLWGTAEHLRQSIGARTAPATRATHGRLKAQAREQLGEEAFEAALTQGRALTMEQAIALSKLD